MAATLMAASGLALIGAPPAVAADTGAFVAITEGGGINASSAGADALTVQNTSATAQITSVSYNTAPALLPDLVWDPDGTAGDVDGRDIRIDTDPGVGYLGRTYSSPNNGVDSDDGWNVVTLDFDDFDPGETLGFSADHDPTSIKGTAKPGPNGSGRVSGFELSGTVVTITFSDGTTESNELFPPDGSKGGGVATVDGDRAAAPTVALLGVAANPATVSSTSQTLRVTGPAGADVRLIQAETALYIDPPGYDIDPYETNMVIEVDHDSAIIGAGGFVDVPVTLTEEGPDAISVFAATVASADGEPGHISNILTVEVDPTATPVLLPGGFGDAEGDTGTTVFNIPITLSAPSSQTVTVDYIPWPCTQFGCVDGLATAGEDFVAVTPDTLTFLPGETAKTVPVTVNGDTTIEPRVFWGEWFFIKFQNPTNATIDSTFFGLGVGVIGNDDP
ncbi:MAG: Calx-beta domain-containing protein [Acidimicrobiales bacterium]